MSLSEFLCIYTDLTGTRNPGSLVSVTINQTIDTHDDGP
jgi:hypothetical protein